MFRKLRRAKQELSKEETIEILKSTDSGVLSISDIEGYAYGVPVNHVYLDGKIYFHCSIAGKKIDGINNNSKVSYTVVDEETVIPAKFATNFKSVIAFGEARIISDDEEKIKILRGLVDRFSKDFKREGEMEIEADLKATAIVEITIEHVTGKESKDFISNK